MENAYKTYARVVRERFRLPTGMALRARGFFDLECEFFESHDTTTVGSRISPIEPSCIESTVPWCYPLLYAERPSLWASRLV